MTMTEDIQYRPVQDENLTAEQTWKGWFKRYGYDGKG